MSYTFDSAAAYSDRIDELELERGKLRAALVGLVGADGQNDLATMEAVMRLMRMPESDRINTLNAIHALQETLPKVAES